MEEKSEACAVQNCCLLSGLRWSLKRFCPKKLRRFCKRVRKVLRNAVSSGWEEERCSGRERSRVTANGRDDGSQDLGQQREQKGRQVRKQRMLMKGKIPIKRRRGEEESSAAAKRFRSLLPLSASGFTFHSVLGKGGFGKVVLASVRDSPVAVKLISKKAMTPESVIKERRILEVARSSPFLCHGYAAFQTQTCAVLVMEYMAGGSLESYLRRFGSFTDTAAAFYSAEMACGVRFLHSRGIIHRDLKPGNVLLDAEGHAKLCDFGCVAENVFGAAQATGHCGTFMYMAPEVHLKQAYGAAADWWSFGVTLFRMLNGGYPFYDGDRRRSLLIHILYGSPWYPQKLSRNGLDILKQLLKKDPQRRLGVEGDVRRHPFFRSIDWEDIESRRATPPYRPEVRADFHRKRLRKIPSLLRPPEDVSSSSGIKRLSGFTFVTPDWMMQKD